MTGKTALFACLGACLALAACGHGPSTSGASSSREAEAAKLERKAELVEGLLARRASAARALDALTLALPGGAWLTEVVYGPTGIQVRGNAPANNLLADYLTRLYESSALADVTLRGSSLRTTRGRERVEFLLAASARGAGAAPSSAGATPASRLEALEKALPARQDPSAMLRELQRLALESGLQMTKFVPGVEVAGEFTGELAATIEVAGGLADVGRYLRGLAGLSRLWVVEKLSLKAAAPDDPRSGVRASISARAHFAR
ncbi:MAG TPA: type 4a pilus biogenesis protein PilO [Candidatus Aminicenantes bacterium]|nr:type 4a pilus biogenesis protein PilO [Candidatus Aminicenantes bacterium]